MGEKNKLNVLLKFTCTVEMKTGTEVDGKFLNNKERKKEQTRI